LIIIAKDDHTNERAQVIWAETPTNPTLRLVPIALIASLAKRHGIPFVIDNTFSSPYYQSPLALGATIVVHSMTKYINGHSDVLLGGVATGDVALLKKLRFLQNANGNVPSPFDCWLCLRGRLSSFYRFSAIFSPHFFSKVDSTLFN
jgi:cystathionine gamma-lyase